ncbi:hypothetical protein Kisp02_59240 [Kineosporia sp. NBRC 101731]|nr:hypothetical protein Kisp02_59240 [Kineosporia sp. NBRC 101731]
MKPCSGRSRVPRGLSSVVYTWYIRYRMYQVYTTVGLRSGCRSPGAASCGRYVFPEAVAGAVAAAVAGAVTGAVTGGVSK